MKQLILLLSVFLLFFSTLSAQQKRSKFYFEDEQEKIEYTTDTTKVQLLYTSKCGRGKIKGCYGIKVDFHAKEATTIEEVQTKYYRRKRNEKFVFIPTSKVFLIAEKNYTVL